MPENALNTLIEEMGLSDVEALKRKERIELTEHDFENIKALAPLLKPHLEEIIS